MASKVRAAALLCLVCLFLLLPCGSACAQGETTVLAVTSDVHFTLLSNQSLYPMSERIVDLMNALADQVIEHHPDALILCGDNTNSGRSSDAAVLAAILGRVRAAGIQVVVIPGNHDFDLGTAESFRELYRGLCDAEAFDSVSLSYMLHVGPLRLLAMDDSSSASGAGGVFTRETMLWLIGQLEEAADVGETVLFLSHHNVLPGGEAAADSRYMIQNPELRDLLLEYGVRLCLSGHRHSQEIMSHGELYEVVSAMPAVSPHLLGSVEVTDSGLSYRAEPLELENYGEPYSLGEILSAEGFSADAYQGTLQSMTQLENYTETERAQILLLFQRFMEHYSRGTLGDVRESILADPLYDAFREVFSTTNYGPWMEALLHSELLPGNRLDLAFPAS